MRAGGAVAVVRCGGNDGLRTAVALLISKGKVVNEGSGVANLWGCGDRMVSNNIQPYRNPC